jgi:hypothetical protein
MPAQLGKCQRQHYVAYVEHFVEQKTRRRSDARGMAYSYKRGLAGRGAGFVAPLATTDHESGSHRFFA